MSRQPAYDDLAAVVEPLVAAAGADLEDVTVKSAGRRTLLQIFVDADGGIGLDEIADISTAISTKLDQIDLFGAAPYTLEVSSPGADRPLTAPKHWRRAAGRLVRAHLRSGVEIIGRVAESDDSAVTLDVGGDQQRLAYEEIAKARVEVEFNRPGGDNGEEK
jgi:ribosome maturation factor RimP